MSQPEQYQDIVLGSGAGGKLLAWHLARSGRRVAVIERRWIGGSCPNIACMPSKNEIWSAKVADLVRHSQFASRPPKWLANSGARGCVRGSCSPGADAGGIPTSRR